MIVAKYETLASEFCKAIKTLVEKPDNLDNFECYLSFHFPVWMEKWANCPENITAELNQFANMEI